MACLGRLFGATALLLMTWLGTTPVSAAKTSLTPASAPASLVWPAPPELPRIAFVQSITRPADAGVKSSAWGRFANWISGSDKGNEVLQRPFGVSLDEHDNLCLADTEANVVCHFDRVRKKWQRWGKAGNLWLGSPVAVVSRNERFFVADSSLGAVVVFDNKGKLSFLITNKLERPTGLALAGERLWVADSQRHCVVGFDLGGRYLSELGRRGGGPGEFNFPTHITVDATGLLYVTDSLNNRVQVFDATGVFQSQIGSIGDTPGHFSRPKGVAVDSFGHVYVIDAVQANIQIFDRAGRFLLNLGEQGSGPGQFYLPNGIAIGRSNDIFVADSYNRRVQVFKYIGQP